MGYGTTRPVCRTNWYKDFSIGTVKSSWVEDTGSVFVSLCKSGFGNMYVYWMGNYGMFILNTQII